MNTRQKIRQLYQKEPNISSGEIIAMLNIKPTRGFWKILTEERMYMLRTRSSNHAANRV